MLFRSPGRANPGVTEVAPGRVAISKQDFEMLLAVATMYVEAFEPDEKMTLVERLRLAQVEDLLAKYGRRY